MIIAIDFDGTCVAHEYPEIGRDIGAVPVLKEMIKEGHQLILFTMRSGTCLGDAIQWFMDNGIPLHGVNKNPTQSSWTDSPKAYAEMYIDDAALGVPLIKMAKTGERDCVDWVEVRDILICSGVI